MHNIIKILWIKCAAKQNLVNYLNVSSKYLNAGKICFIIGIYVAFEGYAQSVVEALTIF